MAENENGEKKEGRGEQKGVEKFMKEFFKTETAPDTWESEKTLGVFRVDGYNEKLNIVWEYDGPFHYTRESTIEKDKKRKEYFSQKYNFIVIPYFCTLNKTLTRYYLKKAFEAATEKNFEEALASNHDSAAIEAYGSPFPTPGWHGSPHTPFRFAEEGKKRFLKELDELPEETQHQIIHSLKIVLKRCQAKTLNNPLNKDIVEKIRDFKGKDEHIKNWEFKLEKKKP